MAAPRLFRESSLPPVGKDELNAIGRTNDAILYGGRVIVWVDADDTQLAELGPKVPSSASPDHGEPFAAIVQRGHVAGVQFHPEKSGEVGLRILRNFVELAG